MTPALRSFSAGLSFLACMHATLLTTPAFAQPSKPPAARAKAPVPPQDLIQKGQLQFDEQQYEESIQSLSAALLRPSNTPAQRVEVYRLLALNYITLGRKDEAENAVRGLLVQQPDYQIPTTESPRFRDFFSQARAKWEAEGRPGIASEDTVEKPIVLRHGSPAQVAAGENVELHARLDDPDERTGSVRLYYRSGSKGDFTPLRTRVDGVSVRVVLPGAVIKPPVVDYYFEVLDGAGGVIAMRGDSASPLRFAVAEPSKGGWVVPVAIGGGVLGAAAIVGVLVLAGVFKSSPSDGGSGGRGPSTVSISIGDSSR